MAAKSHLSMTDIDYLIFGPLCVFLTVDVLFTIYSNILLIHIVLTVLYCMLADSPEERVSVRRANQMGSSRSDVYEVAEQVSM